MYPEKFSYSCPFVIEGKADGLRFSKDQVNQTEVEGLDRFEALEKEGVIYRLYVPGKPAPVPDFVSPRRRGKRQRQSDADGGYSGGIRLQSFTQTCM